MMLKLLILLSLAFLCNAQDETYAFSDTFWFGVSTASYQVEGAWNTDGKGENIWDKMVHSVPNPIFDNSTGDVACDTYHKTEEDVELLADLGVQFYRFSISWSRILPTGHANEINEAGVQYYSDLIDALLEKNIQPFVTMYHWDLPQPLQEIGGWPNPLLANYFENYARVLYERFGDRVKNWLTFNEPLSFCTGGYESEFLAPMYTQDGIGGYLCAHTVLRAHGKAFEIYDTEFRSDQNGRVGISLDTTWYEPLSDSEEDIEIAERQIQMKFGWFAHPIFSEEGDYPAVMRARINSSSEEQGFAHSRLPSFTQEEIEQIRDSSDFFGLNHYSAEACTTPSEDTTYAVPSSAGDIGANCYIPDDWETAGLRANTPWGLRRLLNWIKNEYNNPEVIITENGYGDWTGTLTDCFRIDFYNQYLQALLEAINEDDCNVIGYSAWSFFDNFEWSLGYMQKYGLIHVDFEDDERPRTRKMSFYAYQNIIDTKRIDTSFTPEGWEACS